MNCRTILAVLGSVAIYPLGAETPTECLGQLIPLKPVSLSCSNPVPVCVTDQSGINGHWVWGCPQTTTSSPSSYPNDALSSYFYGLEQAQQQKQFDKQIEMQRMQMEQAQAPGAGTAKTVWKQEGTRAPNVLGTVLASVPNPTGNKKIDESNWKFWLRQHREFKKLLPAWSPEAYETVRSMAASWGYR
jgi:hypothetical protein